VAEGSAPGWQRAQIAVAVTLLAVVIILALHLAAAIFIPFTLAAFFCFLLSPPVTYLQHRGLGRVPSVILVTVLAALLVICLSTLVGRQVSGLIAELPSYTPNIKAKVRSLREAGLWHGAGRFEQMYEEIAAELNNPPPPPPPGADRAIVVTAPTPWLGNVLALVPPLFAVFAQTALTIVLLVFMLLKREDLRNRFIRLTGQGHLTVTTRAVDEASRRISHFLLAQLLLNSMFGVAVTLGLWVLGVRYAILWGVVAAVMRYVPYLGTWLGLIVPLTLSAFAAPGWTQPLLVLAWYVILELIAANILEPWLYGSTVGVSEVALLIMAAVWTIIWGPIGLMLANPMTVCLVVLGKYVPQLKALDILLGDAPPLDPEVTYYQRLLARDQDEATDIVRAYVGNNGVEQVYDGLLLPALWYAKRDRDRDELSDEDETFVLNATREIMTELGPAPDAGAEPDGEVRVLGLATHDSMDETALALFRQLLGLSASEMQIADSEMLAGEQIRLVSEKHPSVICIAAMPPGGLAHAKYLCKRLRKHYPAAKLLVGRWGLRSDREANEHQLREAGADQVGFTILESRTQLRAWLPVAESEAAEKASASVEA
jgi:predicted PurR-regulated permease PerM